jgi:crossover junction endodeoxyribonuclease RusA
MASVDGGMILTLPYPPSNNRYYRNWKGRMVLSGEGLAYRMAVLERRPKTGWPMLGRLRMQIEVFPNRGVGQDLDNIPKAICDSLQKAGIFYNDSQIDDLRIIRKPKQSRPSVVVTMEELGGP